MDLPKVTLTADMPIQQPEGDFVRRARGERLVRVKSVPREMFDATAERQSERNHRQTLERIRERGGFDASEAVAILAGLPLDGLPAVEDAHRILYAMVALMNRGRRLAEAEMREPA